MALTNPNSTVRLQQLVEYKTKLEAILQSKNITAISGMEATTVEGALAELLTKINNVLSTVYRPAGNIASSGLLSSLLVKANLGKVYNLTDDATTTNDWVEGSGKTIPSGTDVGIVAVENGGTTTYKFNAFSTKIDLSGYKTVQTAVADGDATTSGNALTFVDSVTQSTNGNITVHKKTVQSATPYASAQSPGQDGLLSASDKAKLDAITYATDSDIDEIFN